MSGGVPVGASGRVDPAHPRIEPGSRFNRNRGADFSTRHPRSESLLPARVGEILLAQIREELSERDLQVIKFVGELRLASGRQVRRLFFPDESFATAETAARSCRRVLNRLAANRLLRRLQRRVGGVRAGSDGFVYALGPIGFRLVQPEGRSRPRSLEPSNPFVDHQLSVSEFAVELSLAERRGEIKQLVLQGEPRCWRRLPGQRARAGLLRPDLHVRLWSGDAELWWFVEVDLGTTHLPGLLGKCALYESYYRAGAEQAKHRVFPRVLWVCPTATRAAKLEASIGRSRGLTRELFRVATTSAAMPMLQGAETDQ